MENILLSLEQIKQYELELLIDFAYYCDHHQLRYYLCSGTLLGAIRHKGFIPWDDDIDLIMPRPDYERLLKLNEQEPVNDHSKLANVRNLKIPYPFTKIMDTRVSINPKLDDNVNYLCIDIFPMDGLPNNKILSNLLFKICLIPRLLIASRYGQLGAGKTKISIVAKTIVYPVARYIGAFRCARFIEYICKKCDFNTRNYVAAISWSLTPNERIEKSKWIPYHDVEFEGHIFHASVAWDQYLRALYGDYMKLPPESEQKAYHFTQAWINNGGIQE